MDRQTVLVLGASGMVGSKFVEKYASDFEVLIPGENEMDLTDGVSVSRYVDRHPELNAIVNFAAYTNVSEAQKMKGDRESICWRVNVSGAENLAEAIKDKDIYLVQVSTDMVFPGDDKDRGPYAEDHRLEPDEDGLTWYGYSKAMAEKVLALKLKDFAILRIIYPVTKEYGLKMDYLRGPINYYEKNSELYPIFEDQEMNISDIDEVNTAIKVLVDGQRKGVFHAGASDISSPYLIMKRLFELVYGNSEMVKPGSLKEFLKSASDPTRYPMYGGLLNEITQKSLEIKFSSCVEIVDRLYKKSSGK